MTPGQGVEQAAERLGRRTEEPGRDRAVIRRDTVERQDRERVRAPGEQSLEAIDDGTERSA
jgi:hypothetical protein